MIKVAEQLEETGEKEEFFQQMMNDKVRALADMRTENLKTNTEVQEKLYMLQLRLKSAEKENSRLRLYMNRCKQDIEKQFPKTEIPKDWDLTSHGSS